MLVMLSGQLLPALPAVMTNVTVEQALNLGDEDTWRRCSLRVLNPQEMATLLNPTHAGLGGSGIGLALVHQITGLHGGSVRSSKRGPR
jgi:hypothetical protein